MENQETFRYAAGDQIGNYTVLELLEHTEYIERYRVQNAKGETYSLRLFLSEDKMLIREWNYRVSRQRSAAHPNLCAVVETIRSPPAVVLDVDDGELLSRKLEEEALSEDETLRIGAKVLSVLMSLHAQRITHQSISPDSILMTTDKHGRTQPKLLELGIGYESEPRPDVWRYAAPEVANRPERAEARSDLYSTAMTMVRMLGTNLIEGEDLDSVKKSILNTEIPDLGELFPELSKERAAVLQQALDRSTLTRYPTSKAFLDAMNRTAGFALEEDEDLDAKQPEDSSSVPQAAQESEQKPESNKTKSSSDKNKDSQPRTNEEKQKKSSIREQLKKREERRRAQKLEEERKREERRRRRKSESNQEKSSGERLELRGQDESPVESTSGNEQREELSDAPAVNRERSSGQERINPRSDRSTARSSKAERGARGRSERIQPASDKETTSGASAASRKQEARKREARVSDEQNKESSGGRNSEAAEQGAKKQSQRSKSKASRETKEQSKRSEEKSQSADQRSSQSRERSAEEDKKTHSTKTEADVEEVFDDLSEEEASEEKASEEEASEEDVFMEGWLPAPGEGWLDARPVFDPELPVGQAGDESPIGTDWSHARDDLMGQLERPGGSKRNLMIPGAFITFLLAVLYYSVFMGRDIHISFINLPKWGRHSATFDQGELLFSRMKLKQVAYGAHKVGIKGGIYDGKVCVRCCWEESFDIEVDYGVGPLSVPLELKSPSSCPSEVLGYDFSLAPAGSYLMGSIREDTARKPDEFLHAVSITNSYLIGQTEVPQKLYSEVMGANPSLAKGEGMAVEQVSWIDAVTFANRLSELEGLPTCYVIEGEKVLWEEGPRCLGYRLPTEAEWEYAAKAGGVLPENIEKAGEASQYSGSYDLDVVGWYRDNANKKPHKMAGKQANDWGIFDMSGGLHEWVWDYYGPYNTKDSIDPRGERGGELRVLRGGDWYSGARKARVTSRDSAGPRLKTQYIGFRIVRTSLDE